MIKSKIILVILACLCIIGVYYYASNKDIKEVSVEDIIETETKVEENLNIIVHISGSVNNSRNCYFERRG